TVGWFHTSTAAFNVIAGEAKISIDLRASTNSARNAAMAEIKGELERIASARDVELTLSVLQDLPACQFASRLVKLMEDAVDSTGIRSYRLVSGAGHDAMTVATLAPVAMLFIRCEQGISHNAAERVSASDVDIAARALVQFVKTAGNELI